MSKMATSTAFDKSIGTEILDTEKAVNSNDDVSIKKTGVWSLFGLDCERKYISASICVGKYLCFSVLFCFF